MGIGSAGTIPTKPSNPLYDAVKSGGGYVEDEDGNVSGGPDGDGTARTKSERMSNNSSKRDKVSNNKSSGSNGGSSDKDESDGSTLYRRVSNSNYKGSDPTPDGGSSGSNSGRDVRPNYPTDSGSSGGSNSNSGSNNSGGESPGMSQWRKQVQDLRNRLDLTQQRLNNQQQESKDNSGGSGSGDTPSNTGPSTATKQLVTRQQEVISKLRNRLSNKPEDQGSKSSNDPDGGLLAAGAAGVIALIAILLVVD